MDSSAISKSIAALRISIKQLASCSDSLRPWLHFFVTLVVIGVVLEVVFVLWEYCERRKEHRRGTIRSPQKPSAWKLLFELFGVALVAIGVAGELVVDIKFDGIQTTLREKNGELTKLLEDVAASALTTASQNEKDAASLRKEAEHERFARVELEAETVPKFLTEKEEQEITEACRPFGTPSIKVLIETSLGYGYEVGVQIEGSLRKAGFTVDLIRTQQVWYGVNVGGPTDHWDTVTAVVDSIFKPLNFVGIIWRLPPGSPIRLQVGEKLILPPRELTAKPQRSQPAATTRTNEKNSLGAPNTH